MPRSLIATNALALYSTASPNAVSTALTSISAARLRSHAPAFAHRRRRRWTAARVDGRAAVATTFDHDRRAVVAAASCLNTAPRCS